MACQTPLKSLNNKKVVTIEGLSPNGTHPVQAAWEKHNVAQCGYCQTGQITARKTGKHRRHRAEYRRDGRVLEVMEGVGDHG